jgi:hypothetical protein
MLRSARRFALVSALALAASSASATSYTLSGGMDGLQETPPVATPGTGTITGTYDSDTNFLTWDISFQDLAGTTTLAHFHGPAAVGVGPAGVRLATAITVGLTSGSLSGSATISDAFEAELLGGLWYHNIHTSLHGGGEIRGQVYAAVVPEPGTLLLLGAGLLGLAAQRRLRARG